MVDTASDSRSLFLSLSFFKSNLSTRYLTILLLYGYCNIIRVRVVLREQHFAPCVGVPSTRVWTTPSASYLIEVWNYW
jgi:hypothetical protein